MSPNNIPETTRIKLCSQILSNPVAPNQASQQFSLTAHIFQQRHSQWQQHNVATELGGAA